MLYEAKITKHSTSSFKLQALLHFHLSSIFSIFFCSRAFIILKKKQPCTPLLRKTELSSPPRFDRSLLAAILAAISFSLSISFSHPLLVLAPVFHLSTCLRPVFRLATRLVLASRLTAHRYHPLPSTSSVLESIRNPTIATCHITPQLAPCFVLF